MENVHIKPVNFEDFDMKDLMVECTNHAQVSDIMRLEILYKYGGIYIDCDAIALRPFGKIVVYDDS